MNDERINQLMKLGRPIGGGYWRSHNRKTEDGTIVEMNEVAIKTPCTPQPGWDGHLWKRYGSGFACQNCGIAEDAVFPHAEPFAARTQPPPVLAPKLEDAKLSQSTSMRLLSNTLARFQPKR